MFFVMIGAILGMLGVIAGAFGAHGLEGHISADDLDIYEKGVRYQMYGALALLALGLLPAPCKTTSIAGWCLTLGTVIFSGTLYLLVLVGPRSWGAITPIGGTLMILGWALFACAAWRRRGWKADVGSCEQD